MAAQALVALPAVSAVALCGANTGTHRVVDVKSDGKVTVLDATNGKQLSFQMVVNFDGTNAVLQLARLD
jgi:hypothetical protein